MIGWRYIAKTDSFELVHYIHDGKGITNRKILFPNIYVKSNQVFKVGIELSRNSVNFAINGLGKQYYVNKSFTWLKRLVSSWFGGQKAAPHDMELTCKLL